MVSRSGKQNLFIDPDHSPEQGTIDRSLEGKKIRYPEDPAQGCDPAAPIPIGVDGLPKVPPKEEPVKQPAKKEKKDRTYDTD